MVYCKCGCGKEAPTGKKFIRGHWTRTAAAKKMFESRRRPNVKGNPSKFCKCGCGKEVPIAKDNRPERGYYKGQRVNYLQGHGTSGKRGALASRWAGGKHVSTSGYIYLHRPEHPNCTQYGYVLEHRLAMEKKLGRYLEPWEKVHHINGDQTDNRIENLVITSLSEHMRGHEPWKYRKNIREQASKAGRKGAEARWGKTNSK
jgi:hypothetical protein